MREITPEPFKVFTFAELDESAQRTALENVADSLSSTWGDSFDIESITETITYALAEALGTPGWDTFGEGDFPGIPNVEVTGWDMDRGSYMVLKGELTRENAPELPWRDGMEYVSLSDGRDFTRVFVEYEPGEDDYTGVVRAMRGAVDDAIDKAWRAGRDAREHIGSEENAREHIEANEPEFYADGSLYL